MGPETGDRARHSAPFCMQEIAIATEAYNYESDRISPTLATIVNRFVNIIFPLLKHRTLFFKTSLR